MIKINLALIDTDEKRLKFEQLYNKYRHLMFYVANRILHDEFLAEDATQEAFLRIAKNFDKVGEIDSPKTKNFITVITRNAALTIQTGRSDEIEMDIDECEEGALLSESEDVFNKVSVSLLKECVFEIPQIYRDCLYLYYRFGYSISEVSNFLGISVELGKKRLQRGRKILKDLLQKEGYIH